MVEDNGSLYYRIGGESGVAGLVDSFYEKVLKEESLRDFFEHIPMQQLKNMQKEFFTIALGGPSKYSDIKLTHAHQGKGIKTAHFSTFVDLLFSTLSELDLNEDERYLIISQVNTYVDDIVDDTESLVD